ncbi:hypothetical protein LCGC14_0849620 [marine sediment metagenome]|uniref:Uncharacterized protein n=1 Tax=marine sediment metagenome TaxID=412755 RepID=A0A0F9PFJ0_9ZZZZ
MHVAHISKDELIKAVLEFVQSQPDMTQEEFEKTWHWQLALMVMANFRGMNWRPMQKCFIQGL